MRSLRPIIAAIPNYNMGEQLAGLLPQLAEQEYQEIFVLDDGSTDGSRDIVHTINSSVRFIGDGENRGAGGARNQIIGQLSHRAIIHFIDADMVLETERVREVANTVMPDDPVGFVGGLVTTADNLQSIWNYGPRSCLRSSIGARIQAKIEPLLTSDPQKAAALRVKHRDLLSDWPNPARQPARRQVFWTLEGSMLIDSQVFENVGGFDPNLREHDSLELAIRMHKRGLPRFFDPLLAAQHKDVNVRHYNRNNAKIKAELQIMGKHGPLNWLMPDGRFKPEL